MGGLGGIIKSELRSSKVYSHRPYVKNSSVYRLDMRKLYSERACLRLRNCSY